MEGYVNNWITKSGTRLRLNKTGQVKSPARPIRNGQIRELSCVYRKQERNRGAFIDFTLSPNMTIVRFHKVTGNG